MRKPRILIEGSRYHVCARANRKEMILESADCKELFMATVERAKLRYNFRIETFCIMGNHYHLIIQPARGSSLSIIMQWIMSVFAMGWNRKFKLTGHVWGERFFSTVLSDLLMYLKLFFYIEENPVRANLVKAGYQWQYSGVWQFKNGRRRLVDALPDWLAGFLPQYQPKMIPLLSETSWN